ncbi:MAG: acyltransferase family protein [Candidatus Omnitrophota bacterium]
MQNETPRVLWADTVRACAIFAVVLLHSASPLTYRYNEIPHLDWWVSNIYDSFARICVPLFVILSGSLLLGKEESYKIFFKKRFKIVVPFISFGIFYIVMDKIYHGEAISIYKIIRMIISGPMWYHLWFFYMILGLYLITPVLRKWVKQANRPDYLYFIILWFIVSSIIPIIKSLFQIEFGMEMLFFSGYIGYFILGYKLKEVKLNKLSTMILFAVFIFAYVVTILGSFVLTKINKGEYNGYFFNYLSPNVIVMALSGFTIIKNIKIQNAGDFFNKILINISKASFGIYLIHVFILMILNKGILGLAVNGYLINPIVGIPITAIMCTTVSFAIVYILQKIPIAKFIVP